MKKIFAVLSLSLFFLPAIVSAETVLRTGDSISVGADQTVDGDYYVSVGPIGKTTMSGQVMGDMYALGGSVTVNGVIHEDLSLLAGVAQLHASVTDDVRIVAGETIIAEDIGGDLLVLGNTLQILSSAKVAGNLYFFGESATIEGEVEGSVLGSYGYLRIDGAIKDDVDVNIHSELTLGSKAVVEGSLTYSGRKDYVRSPNAVVEGEVQKRDKPAVSTQEHARGLLLPIFISLFATLSAYLVFRRELERVVVNIDNRLYLHVLLGLGVLLIMPIVSVLLMVSVLGFLVGAFMMAVTIALLLAGYIISSVVCGAYLAKFITKSFQVSFVWIIAGAVVFYGMMFIPVIGQIVFLLIFTMSIGLLVNKLYRSLR